MKGVELALDASVPEIGSPAAHGNTTSHENDAKAGIQDCPNSITAVERVSNFPEKPADRKSALLEPA
ncbi:MAG: hypothetical protein WCL27_12355, partial [Betaproteobacteria bacterium]